MMAVVATFIKSERARAMCKRTQILVPSIRLLDYLKFRTGSEKAVLKPFLRPFDKLRTAQAQDTATVNQRPK